MVTTLARDFKEFLKSLNSNRVEYPNNAANFSCK